MKANDTKKIIKTALSIIIVPVLILYIFIAKPDYKILNAVSGIVVPAGQAAAAAASWPVRAIGRLASNIRDLSQIRRENKILRIQLDEVLRAQNECASAVSENQKLYNDLNLTRQLPGKSVLARIIRDDSGLGNDAFQLDRGAHDGIAAGQAVVSKDGFLIGIVESVMPGTARVRGLNDHNTNIIVRLGGTDVFGFLGARRELANFSEPEFKPTAGTMLYTSTLNSGIPANLSVGRIEKAYKNSASIEFGKKWQNCIEAAVIIK
ncbi:MAG: rod shape-determining protein MreC [Rickettsiales bacterium]|jgi:cell shape-determining protein MreC|nr:rod shape-determining protein MreC [Rickettsiales bacterium]